MNWNNLQPIFLSIKTVGNIFLPSHFLLIQSSFFLIDYSEEKTQARIIILLIKINNLEEGKKEETGCQGKNCGEVAPVGTWAAFDIYLVLISSFFSWSISLVGRT